MVVRKPQVFESKPAIVGGPALVRAFERAAHRLVTIGLSHDHHRSVADLLACELGRKAKPADLASFSPYVTAAADKQIALLEGLVKTEADKAEVAEEVALVRERAAKAL